jgi:Zn-finger nucleic acid-binding protein
MSHLKCMPCKVRVHHTGKLGDPVGDLCPQCGGPLEPVGDLEEIVGFGSVRPSRSAAYTPAAASQQAVAVRQQTVVPRPTGSS